MLKVKNLHKYYHNFARKPLHVINDTTIEIPETGIIAVVGESGAGKTTLINTISSLDSFKSGEIAFDDLKMHHYHNRKADNLRLENYGFIFQNYYLLQNQTVYENVKISLDAFDISEAEKKKRVNYVLSQLGISRYTHKKVTSLSGGEQQRVSIARALVKSPRIIFADEPTGSLDEKTTFMVLNILKKVSQNCAVFIVTHERNLISYYADYIIELNDGVVVKQSIPTKPDEKSLAVDRNVYLKELNHVVDENKEGISLKIYSDGSSISSGEIKIAIQGQKIYLEASEEIKVLNNESENHLIESERFQIKDYVDSDFDYNLEKIPYSRNSLGFPSILKKGFKNFKTKRPIKAILKAMCVALSIVLLAIIEGFNAIQNMDLSSRLTASKGNLYMKIMPSGEKMNNAKLQSAYEYVCQSFEQSSNEIMFVSRDTLSFDYDGFYQLQQMRFILPSNDFKNMDLLDAKHIIYGSMPTNNYEIVIDEYVLKQLIDNSSLKTIVTDYGYFVGKSFSSSYGFDLVVSGVCRTKSPTIYGFASLNLARLSYASHIRVIDIEKIRNEYPQLEDIVIETGHCWRSDYYGDVTFDSLIVDSRFGEEMPYDLIINRSDYATLRARAAYNRNDMYIQTDGKSTSIEEANNLVNQCIRELEAKDLEVSVTITNRYQEEANEATSDLKNILNSVEIIGVVILVLALLFIILSTYLSMVNQIGDIAVYRALGYSRLNLGATYFVEISLLALLYCFIGGAIAYLTMFVLDVIPLIPYTISTPFINVVGYVLLIALAVMFIGLIPIILVFRHTPASIYSRYNHRITNIN